MINFVIALAAEAKPLIEYWRLKKMHSWQPFPVFLAGNCRLIISGTGRSNSAAATAWLASLTTHENTQKPQPQIWLNFGIAGHRDQDIGAVLVGHKITEQASGKNWYPPQIRSTLASSNITTTDNVVTDYAADTLHEMESSGFYATAQRFSSAELIQSIKIVSDNQNNPVNLVDASFASSLVAENIELLAGYTRDLQALEQVLDPPVSQSLYQKLTSENKFSATQQLQLQRLLQRYSIIFGETAPLPAEVNNATRASHILQTLREKLNKAPVSITP